MNVFVADGTGLIGRHLIPQLVGRGHDVVGTAKGARGTGVVEALGRARWCSTSSTPGRCCTRSRARPEVVVHQTTALSRGARSPLRRLVHSHEPFGRRARRNLLAAAAATGAARVVAQSFTGWPNARTGAAHR